MSMVSGPGGTRVRVAFNLSQGLVRAGGEVLMRMTGFKNQAATTRDCPECTMSIPVAARRCPECTAEVTPAIDQPQLVG